MIINPRRNQKKFRYYGNTMKNFLKKYNLLIAPMEGVMRPALIELCNELQVTKVWVTPFLRVSATVPKERELKKFLAPFAPDKHRVILQIMGVDKEKLSETALRGMACGAAGIDLNCGCPSNQVISHGAGAGALQRVEQTAEIISKISSSLNGRGFFSVKTRLGFYSPQEAADTLKLWSSSGQVDMFTLHYRTAVEGYKSVPGREERLRAARAVLPQETLVFGNGDIENTAEAQTLCRELDLNGVMIGRAFWRDVFMLARYFDPSPAIPDAGSARKIFWEKLRQIEYKRNIWSIGNAIELTGMIFGAASPEFAAMKKEFSQR